MWLSSEEQRSWRLLPKIFAFFFFKGKCLSQPPTPYVTKDLLPSLELTTNFSLPPPMCWEIVGMRHCKHFITC